MKNKIHTNRTWFLQVFLIILITFLFNSCELFDKIENEEEVEPADLITKSERLLTAHKWRKTTVYFFEAATDKDPEPFSKTVYMKDMDDCMQDDYWFFNMEYDYELNSGPVKCADEETKSDWGDWGFDDSYDNSSYLVLYTSTWNPELSEGDHEYEVLELTADKLVVRSGGCSDNTAPDEDGRCTTLTFEPY